GEIGVLLINHGKEPFTIQPKMRIAQLILAPVCKANFQSKKCLSETLRLDGGFGHTGV
ncbi:MAG TPA: dUTP diphosphatase, partial [Chlamydiales bacterium]|nr:dUTP diphosphatase [Chlamydiales bacterium]